MASPVKTIQENEIIQQICKTMIQNGIGSVIVVVVHSANAQMPAGIITERDIVRRMAERPISFSEPVNQLMSKPIVTIHPNASLQHALQIMHARDIRRLLVVSEDGNNIAGILTDKDIFRFIARNESIPSGLITDQVLAKNREMAERFNSSLLDDIK
jgi:CBS domain-containing protein